MAELIEPEDGQEPDAVRDSGDVSDREDDSDSDDAAVAGRDGEDGRPWNRRDLSPSVRVTLPQLPSAFFDSIRRAQQQAADSFRITGPWLHLREQISASTAPLIRAQQQAVDAFRITEPYVRMQEQIAVSMAPLLRAQKLALDAARFTELHEGWRRQIEGVVAPLTEAVRQWQRLAIPTEAIAGLARSIKDSLPPNWPAGVPFTRVIELVEETGWALVWVPDEDVISVLLECEDVDVRGKVLAAHADEILASLRRCLDEVEDADLRYSAECAREAAESFEEGRERASQALCASVLTGLIQSTMGYESLARARKELSARTWEDATFPFLRFTVIASTIPTSLAKFDPAVSVPDIFNRHAVAHHPSPVQFTTINSLVALILVTALIRELDELARRGLLRDED